MILDRLYENYTVAGKTFVVGGTVWANEHTGWSGLRGRVTKIETFEGGDGPSACLIHCDFERPASTNLQRNVELNYRKAYRKSLPIAEIQMNDVIFSADAFEPVATGLPKSSKELYGLVQWGIDNADIEQPILLGISSEKDLLLRLMEETIAEWEEPVVLVNTVFYDGQMEFYYEEADLNRMEGQVAFSITRIPLFSASGEVAA